LGEGFQILGYIALLAVVVAVVAYIQNVGRRLHHTYARVAEQRGGRVIDGGFFGRPMIVFSYRGANVVLDVFTSRRRNTLHYTQLHIDWPDDAVRCEVYPEGVFNRLGKLLGMNDLEIGSPNFDATYIITGNSASRIQELLTPGVQLAIEALRRFRYSRDIYVAFQGGELLIKKQSLFRDYAALQEFIRLGLELFDQASAAGSEGIDFIEGEAGVFSITAASAEPPTCQVCGEAITEAMVTCRSCRTPHHKECWKYYGACSTYGCGQKTFRAVR
jgi:hypothetical protein